LIALVVTAAPAVGRGSDQSAVQTYIVVLADSAGDPGKVARDHTRRHGARVRHVYRHALKGYAAALSPNRLAELRADPRVEFVSEEAEFRRVDTCPLDTRSGFPQQCIPPGVDRVEADLSGAAAGDGSGSVDLNVAVVDDG